jgi:hypothetical protein
LGYFPQSLPAEDQKCPAFPRPAVPPAEMAFILTGSK